MRTSLTIARLTRNRGGGERGSANWKPFDKLPVLGEKIIFGALFARLHDGGTPIKRRITGNQNAKEDLSPIGLKLQAGGEKLRASASNSERTMRGRDFFLQSVQ